MSMTRLCRQVGDSDLVARQAIVTVANAIWKGVTAPKGVKRGRNALKLKIRNLIEKQLHLR